MLVSRRTRTFRRAIRRAPIAIASVTVGSRPSGTLATMIPIANTKFVQTRHADVLANHEDQDPCRDRQRGDDATERRELALKGRRRLFRHLRQTGDLAEFRVHPCRNDEAAGTAGRDARAGEQAIAAVQEVRLGRWQRVAAHRVRLAGHGGVVDRQREGLDDPAVCRNAVARLQRDHIARHQLLGTEGGRRHRRAPS